MARADDHLDEIHEDTPAREFTLSTSAILGVFFALALLCASFFGFGYSVGRKSASTAPEASPSSNNTPVAGTDKPPAGSPAIQQVDDANKSSGANQVYVPPTTAAASTRNSAAPAQQPAINQERTTQIPATRTSAPTPEPARQPITAAVNPPPAQPPATAFQAPAQTSAAPAASYVQIAAFSREDDADLVLKALRTRGYSVNASPASDHLIHLQMGPFPTRKDAEAMRQRLIADGYNAIVK